MRTATILLLTTFLLTAQAAMAPRDSAENRPSLESRVAEPHENLLSRVYPNPFNATATIAFTVPQRTTVTLTVYNILGQPLEVLQDGELATGEHRRVWNAADYATGVYFYRLAMNGTVETQKLVLAR